MEIKMERDEFLKKYNVLNYFIDDFDRVCVDGSVLLNNIQLTEIPFQFGVVKGDLNISENRLKSLEGCPMEVGGTFDCSSNLLTSLEYAPSKVGGSFYCYVNKLVDLQGSPSYIEGNFMAAYNKLKSLEGCPEDIYGLFDVSFNPIVNFDYFPMNARAGFYCDLVRGLDEFKERSSFQKNY